MNINLYTLYLFLSNYHHLFQYVNMATRTSGVRRCSLVSAIPSERGTNAVKRVPGTGTRAIQVSWRFFFPYNIIDIHKTRAMYINIDNDERHLNTGQYFDVIITIQ